MLNSDPCCGKTLHCGMREMNATNVISGFSVRPGLFLTNGATIVPALPFILSEQQAVSCACSAAPSSSPMPCCRFPSSSASVTLGQ